MSPTATGGKYKQRRVAVHMSIKDSQTAAQRMGCQMEEIKFEYINEEEQACRHGGRGKKLFGKRGGSQNWKDVREPIVFVTLGNCTEKARNC